MAERIDSGETDVAVSAASVWEIAIKRAKGKLATPENLLERLAEFRPLPITFAHAQQAGTLPLHHADPFDRMLVAQAQLEGLTLVTGDARIARYQVQVLLPC